MLATLSKTSVVKKPMVKQESEVDEQSAVRKARTESLSKPQTHIVATQRTRTRSETDGDQSPKRGGL